MNRMQQMLAQMGLGQQGPVDPDAPLPDTAEKVQISSLSLLKMLKHGNSKNILVLTLTVVVI
jgi:hypothetical protein